MAVDVQHVEYSDMRSMILEHLRWLGSSRWRSENLRRGNGGEVNFDGLLNFLYDTSGLLHDPVGALGLTLASSAEVEAVLRLKDAFERVLDEGGLDGGVPGDDLLWDAIGLESERVVRVLTATPNPLR
ncbi:hypothetical protein ACFYWN_44120 [Streptomyces sp. NPDC002917]|uniref:hypothetical protein n=1 Tax=Streptomyces sp. NPDC002917 TaxID=3364671 RepID=UPI0036B041AC